MTDVAQHTTVRAPRKSIVRAVLRAASRTVTCAIVIAIVVVIGAQIVRDRAVWLAFIMYVPLWLIAGAAIVWDLLLLGRALPLRFLLLCVGVAIGVMAIGMMWAPARAPEGEASQPTVTLLQWNVQWGGLGGPASLDRIVSEIKSRDSQIVCLSEAPPEQYFEFYWKQQNGAGWNTATVRSGNSASHWYRLMILTRWPVRVMNEWRLEHGVAALFEIDSPQSPSRPLRILMVDLESDPSVPRSPSLIEAAKLIESHAVAGTPIDFVLGDFNAPSRFRGFDAIAAAGERYDRTALWSGRWRATWPARLVAPWRNRMVELKHVWRLSTLDIDHIWARRGLDVVSAEIFTNFAVDHRGQTCVVRLKE